jgi:CheY-like chemotaxis protein
MLQRRFMSIGGPSVERRRPSRNGVSLHLGVVRAAPGTHRHTPFPLPAPGGRLPGRVIDRMKGGRGPSGRDHRPPGVVTVDDQAVFRAAAREVIDATPGFQAVGEAASGEEALALLERVDPGLVLMDVRMPAWGAWRPRGASRRCARGRLSRSSRSRSRMTCRPRLRRPGRWPLFASRNSARARCAACGWSTVATDAETSMRCSRRSSASAQTSS